MMPFSRSPRAAAILAFALAMGLALNLIAAPSQVFQTQSGVIPSSLFCLNILFHPQTKVPWPAVPFYGWRLAHANWPDLEPEKGKWYFDLLDKYVGWGQEHHTEILMILAFTPPWASSSPDSESDTPMHGLAGVPIDIEDWKTFVRTVATRYKGKIHSYEIWNEPDRPKAWLGGVDNMVVMVREAAKILKEIDPTITILSPSPSTPKGPEWIEAFLKKGGGQYVDGIAYHFYTPKSGPPEDMVPIIHRVRAIMAQNGAGQKPLMNTEAGWHEPNPFPSDSLAAAYVARSYILNWAAGVNRFYWYCWDNHNWTSLELTMHDNTTLRPAGRAYATIQKWMVGASMNKCSTSDSNDWVVELKRDGADQFLVWNTGGDRSFPLSRDWHVTQYTQLDGTVNKISGDSIQIGVEPVLIQ
jgi:hypothetical protein